MVQCCESATVKIENFGNVVTHRFDWRVMGVVRTPTFGNVRFTTLMGDPDRFRIPLTTQPVGSKVQT